MTILYQLVMIMTLEGQSHIIKMQDELTDSNCYSQLKHLQKKKNDYGMLLPIDSYSENQLKLLDDQLRDGNLYMCLPQRMTGV